MGILHQVTYNVKRLVTWNVFTQEQDIKIGDGNYDCEASRERLK